MVDVTLHNGDCLEYMRTLADGSVDAVVTDPPAGIAFMGKNWDHDKGGRTAWVAWMTEVMAECLRVLKPGGNALVWAIPRTAHWTAMALEDAGFEIRDKVYHIFGSGFPKSHNVSVAIDKAAGAEREVVGQVVRTGSNGNGATIHQEGGNKSGVSDITAPATPEAQQWQGWGTALKPAAEEWILARKPLTGTVAANVLEWGTGAINVDGCRVGTETVTINKHSGYNSNSLVESTKGKWKGEKEQVTGRWPANVVHDGSDEVVGMFPVTTSGKPSGIRKVAGFATAREHGTELTGFGDTGSAARFFYAAKASKADRDEGLEGMEEKDRTARMVASEWKVDVRHPDGGYETAPQAKARNHHPTVKPTSLMRWLCRLITPPQGVILDPFMGSGSTGKAAKIEGFSFIGCDLDADYVEIARRRIDAAQPETAQPTLFEAAD